MKLRTKTLVLLLAMALVPLIATAMVDLSRTLDLGDHLARERAELLEANAVAQLQRTIDAYGALLRRDRAVIERIVRYQAAEVQRGLAASDRARSGPPGPMYFSEDYDAGEPVPADLHPSPRHFREGGGGERIPIPISLTDQVYFLVAGVERDAVSEGLAALAAMPTAYRFWHDAYPELLYWQYTALEEGIHTSYPGHGGYPAGYDPRTRPWYTQARDRSEPLWLVLPEVSTRTVALSVSMPVHDDRGRFAGVTAIDVPLFALFGSLELPEGWSEHARVMLVTAGEGFGGEAGSLVILADQGDRLDGRDWRQPLDLRFVYGDDPAAIADLAADARQGRIGTRRIAMAGRDAIWAHGSGDVFPLVMVPRETVVAPAVQARAYVAERVRQSVWVTAALAVVVGGLATAIAFLAARVVTRPVAALAQTALRLAQGDYAARSEVRTGDELESLSNVLNRVGPQLHERERIKHSLAVAQEVQQNLLPAQSPVVAGVELAGHSTYCDETGGDYYDFLEIADVDDHTAAVALGDVMGHGVAAAMLMATARGILRSRCTLSGSLAELLIHLNELLFEVTGGMRFMTMLLAVIDPRAGRLTWASAGHDPPFIYDPATDRHIPLEGGGLPLGVLGDEVYEEHRYAGLASGQVILLATDGVWEAGGPQGQYGKDRVRASLAAAASAPEASAQSVAEAIRADLRTYRGERASQEDDITFVVIRIT